MTNKDPALEALGRQIKQFISKSHWWCPECQCIVDGRMKLIKETKRCAECETNAIFLEPFYHDPLCAAVRKVRDKYICHEGTHTSWKAGTFADFYYDLTAALSAAPAGEPDDYNVVRLELSEAKREAVIIAKSLAEKHFSDNKEWRVGDKLVTVLLQISNMVTGWDTPPPGIAADDVRKVKDKYENATAEGLCNPKHISGIMEYCEGLRCEIIDDLDALIDAAGPQEPDDDAAFGRWVLSCISADGKGYVISQDDEGDINIRLESRNTIYHYRAAKPDAEEPCATCLDKGYTLNPENIRERIPCPDCAAPDAPEPVTDRQKIMWVMWKLEPGGEQKNLIHGEGRAGSGWIIMLLHGDHNDDIRQWLKAEGTREWLKAREDKYPPAPAPPGTIAADDVRKVRDAMSGGQLQRGVSDDWRECCWYWKKELDALIAAAGPQEPQVCDHCNEPVADSTGQYCFLCFQAALRGKLGPQEPVVPLSVIGGILNAIDDYMPSPEAAKRNYVNSGRRLASQHCRQLIVEALHRHAAKPDAEEPCATCLDKGYTLNPENIRERIPCSDCTAPKAPETRLDADGKPYTAHFGPPAPAPETNEYTGRFDNVHGGPNSIFIDNLIGDNLRIYTRGERVPEADKHSPIQVLLNIEQVKVLISELEHRYKRMLHRSAPAPPTTEQRAAKVCDTAERFVKLQRLVGFHPPEGDLDKEVRKAWCNLANAVRAWLDAEGAKGGGV